MWKPRKTEKFLERFAFQGKGQLREGKLNHKQQPLTSLWSRDLLAFPDLFRDWSQHHIHSWNTTTCSRNTGLCNLYSWRGIVMSAPIEEEELRIYEENREEALWNPSWNFSLLLRENGSLRRPKTNNRPFALSHMTSFFWKWKLHDFAFENH